MLGKTNKTHSFLEASLEMRTNTVVCIYIQCTIIYTISVSIRAVDRNAISIWMLLKILIRIFLIQNFLNIYIDSNFFKNIDSNSNSNPIYFVDLRFEFESTVLVNTIVSLMCKSNTFFFTCLLFVWNLPYNHGKLLSYSYKQLLQV